MRRRPARRPCGRPRLRAAPAAQRTMVDEISRRSRWRPCVDRLGRPGAARSRASTPRSSTAPCGSRSTRVALLLGRAAHPVPAVRRAARRAHRELRRRTGMHSVSRSRSTLPLIGRIYEYAGTFRYEIRTGDARERVSERIVIAGASGFIGRYLAMRSVPGARRHADRPQRAGRRLGRHRGDHAACVDGADLSSTSRARASTAATRREPRRDLPVAARDHARELADAIAACEHPPPLWVNSSTATIYRHAEDRPMTEATGELGTGFSVERRHRLGDGVLRSASCRRTRRVALRMAIVLGDGAPCSR